MKALLKKILKKMFPKLIVFHELVARNDSYLYLTGWMRSFELEKPVDKNGNPIPWMNLSIVKILEEKLGDNLNVFEFGSGYSTYFYAKKVKHIASLEYDKEWYQLLKKDVPGNVDLIYKEKDRDGEYCRVIGTMSEQYDVVIVDGRDRVNCLKQSISALSTRGLIILDDSQREEYKEGIEFVKELGFRALHIEGLKAASAGLSRTTILYRPDNCFGI